VEVNNDFERAMKTARAEAIWIATHIHAERDTSLFAVKDRSRRRRLDIGVQFDMRGCKRALGPVNRKLGYTNQLMRLVSQMARIPLLPPAPWSPPPAEVYKCVRKARRVPERSLDPYELPYRLHEFVEHFKVHSHAAESIILSNAAGSPDAMGTTTASLLSKTSDLLVRDVCVMCVCVRAVM
jgi:hypothetical protein